MSSPAPSLAQHDPEGYRRGLRDGLRRALEILKTREPWDRLSVGDAEEEIGREIADVGRAARLDP